MYMCICMYMCVLERCFFGDRWFGSWVGRWWAHAREATHERTDDARRFVSSFFLSTLPARPIFPGPFPTASRGFPGERARVRPQDCR